MRGYFLEVTSVMKGSISVCKKVVALLIRDKYILYFKLYVFVFMFKISKDMSDYCNTLGLKGLINKHLSVHLGWASFC